MRQNRNNDFVQYFNPYNEEHVHLFIKYKQTGILPNNNEFNPPLARYDIVCSNISNKITKEWYDNLSTKYEHHNKNKNDRTCLIKSCSIL